MDINPRQNGIHSFAKALEAFNKYHKNPDDVFALKDSILRSQHALETVFKDIVYLMNPALLVDENKKIKEFREGFKKWYQGKFATPLDELPTLNLYSTINLLKNLDFFKGLSDKEYHLFLDSVTELCFYRNRLQHFSLTANPDRVGRILGNVLPRTVDVLEPYYSRPHNFRLPINFIEACNVIFPETELTIDILRNNYDKLIQDAINFFKKTPFNNQILNLKIVDHGQVGPPPYYPNLTIEGFIDYKYDFRTRLDLFHLHADQDEEPFSAKITISEPKFTDSEKGAPFSMAEGNLEFDSRILIDRADKILVLENAQDKLSGMRGLTIMIKANLDYKVDIIKNEAHYDCRNIKEATGNLIVRLHAIPKGYKSDEIELIGAYQSEINQDTAPFRLHSFLEPDGSLKHDAPLMFEWTINSKGNLSFK